MGQVYVVLEEYEQCLESGEILGYYATLEDLIMDNGGIEVDWITLNISSNMN